MLKFRTISLSFLLLSILTLDTIAQRVHTTAVSFGGECLGKRYKFSTALKSMIRRNREGNYQNCKSGNQWCDNSFAFDLNGDKRKEYFVRSVCGATGNCTYGIFADRPARLIGKVNGWFLWIDRSGVPWKKITTYSRAGGDQGYIQTHAFRRGKYRPIRGRTEHSSSRQKPFYVKMGMPDCTE